MKIKSYPRELVERTTDKDSFKKFSRALYLRYRYKGKIYNCTPAKLRKLTGMDFNRSKLFLDYLLQSNLAHFRGSNLIFRNPSKVYCGPLGPQVTFHAKTEKEIQLKLLLATLEIAELQSRNRLKLKFIGVARGAFVPSISEQTVGHFYATNKRASAVWNVSPSTAQTLITALEKRKLITSDNGSRKIYPWELPAFEAKGRHIFQQGMNLYVKYPRCIRVIRKRKPSQRVNINGLNKYLL